MRVRTRFSRVTAVFGGVVAVAGCGASPVGHPGAPAMHRASAPPLSFAPNAGQLDRRVRFFARAGGTSLFFTDRGVAMVFGRPGSDGGLALRMRFAGADRHARLQAGRPDGGTLNALLGDRSRWKRGLPTSRELVYRGLWPGIDLVFRDHGGTLKYEFHVAAGADIRAIGLVYDGARRLTRGRDGTLSIHTAAGVLTDASPVSYQTRAGARIPVEANYAPHGASYGFALGAGYDPARALVIDPGIAYSTLLGGTDADEGLAIAVDSHGDAYVAGRTLSADYPTTLGAFDTTRNGPYGTDAFVTKLDPTGSAVVYSTLLGGSDTDEALDIAVDAEGSAYVTGQTWSADFPATGGSAGGLGDAFATKLSGDGSVLEYSTRLGGSLRDMGLGIAVRRGSASITGYTASDDFPVTEDSADPSFNGATDAFVTTLGPTGTATASTYVGGSDGDAGFAIALDDAGRAYLTGRTSSADYPTTPGVAAPTPGEGPDALVARLSADESTLEYSTRLGGAGLDSGSDIAVARTGAVFVTGVTASPDYPTTAGAADPTFDGVTDAFVTALSADGLQPVYSTFFGGSARDEGAGIAVDRTGSVYVTGQSWSADLPSTGGASDATLGGAADGFVAELAPGGDALSYVTYLGGADFDAGAGIALHPCAGEVLVTGQTLSSDFPVSPGAFDTSFAGRRDAFVTKLRLRRRQREADEHEMTPDDSP